MSSYNNFLANVEVDHDEIKRETLKRKQEAELNKKKLQKQKIRQIPNQPNNRKPVVPKGNKPSKQNYARPKSESVRINSVQKRTQSNAVKNRVGTVNIQKQNVANQSQFKSVNRDIAKVRTRDYSKPIVSSMSNSKRPPSRNLNRNLADHNKYRNLAKTKIGDDLDNKVYKFAISKKEYKAKVIGTKRQDSTKYVYMHDDKKRIKVPPVVALLGMYGFVLSVVMIYYFSRVGVVKGELREINNEYSKLSEENVQLNINLATAYNIDNIRQRAENELYMSKPEAHQIIYISVEPENYAEYEMGSENE